MMRKVSRQDAKKQSFNLLAPLRLGVSTTSRRLGLDIFLFFLFLYLLTANGRIVNRDGEAMFQVARSIAERGRLDIPVESALEIAAGPRGTEGDSLSFATETAKRGADGNLYAMYGLGQSLASVPFYYAGKAMAAALPQVSPYFATRFAAAMLNPLVSALTCAALFAFARSLGFSVRGSLVATLVYGVATMAWPYSKSYASEPLLALMLVAAAYCLARSRSALSAVDYGSLIWPALAGAALGFAVMVRVSAVVLLPVFAAYWLGSFTAEGAEDAERKRIYSGSSALSAVNIAFFLPIGLILAAIGWYNYARFGSPLVTGYQSVAWNRPIIEGLYGLLLSPGKGLLWYNPVLLASMAASAAFYRRRRREALFFAGLGLVWIVFHSPYRFWEGGWSWGPRLMMPILPFLVLPLAAISDRSAGLGGRSFSKGRLLPVAVALGLAVQVSAVGVDYTRYLWDNYSARPEDAYARVIHLPAGSPLIQQWPALATVLGNAVRPGELGSAREAIAAKDADDSLSEGAVSVAVLEDTQLAGLNFPDFWFIYLYLFGAPAVVVAPAGLALLVGMGCMLLILDRRLRDLEPEKGGSG